VYPTIHSPWQKEGKGGTVRSDQSSNSRTEQSKWIEQDSRRKRADVFLGKERGENELRRSAGQRGGRERKSKGLLERIPIRSKSDWGIFLHDQGTTEGNLRDILLRKNYMRGEKEKGQVTYRFPVYGGTVIGPLKVERS